MLKVFIPRFVFIIFASMIMYSLSYAENLDTKVQKHNAATELEYFVKSGAVLIVGR